MAPGAQAQQAPMVLGTTVGLAQTGLLDVLVPLFERQSGRAVTVVAVSAPQALGLGMRGEVEVLLLDADDDEASFMAGGHGVDRQLVMHAADVLLGPPGDPAQVQQAAAVEDALRRIADAKAGWVSRADNSGLHQQEKRLWHEAGVEPVGQGWYVPLGQGMIPTLQAATERQAYTLADRRTYLEQHDHLDLVPMVEGAPELLRLYHALVVNPDKGQWLDGAGARAFVAFLLGDEAQAAIRSHGVERLGQPIFTPDAGRSEQELRPDRRPVGARS